MRSSNRTRWSGWRRTVPNRCHPVRRSTPWTSTARKRNGPRWCGARAQRRNKRKFRRYGRKRAMRKFSGAVALVGLAAMIAQAKPGSAAEVTALISNALTSVMTELTPQFEKATGHRLRITLGSTNPLKAKIEKGEAFDFTVLGAGAIDELIRQGRLVTASRTDIARSGMGVAIRSGAPKPNISTAEAFKHTLLNSKSIGYLEDGLSGAHLQVIFQRLGITD